MASALSLVLFVVLLAVHTLVAAVLTRYFRIALNSSWGKAFFTVAAIPVVLVASTLVFTGVFGIGPDIGNPVLVFAILVFGPQAIGALVDYLYIPPPEAYDLPDTTP
jgi:hypothetical protein